MKRLLLLLTITLFSMTFIQADTTSQVIDIVKQLESNNDPTKIGDNGASWGILQIQQIAIDDVNIYYGTQYIHQDAFEISCSEEIFILYTQLWSDKILRLNGKRVNEFDMIRIWNGGPKGYLKTSTLAYLNKYITIIKNTSMNRRKVLIDGKLGIVTASYTHTADVYLFKEKRTMGGVHKRYIKLLPLEPTGDRAQLSLNLV